MATTPKRERRQLAMAELVLGVAGSYAVTEPANGDDIARKYGLGQDDMKKIYEAIGARMEAWAIRLGYDRIWDDDTETPPRTERPMRDEPAKQTVSVTWDDIKEGRVVRYEHVSRARRLAGKPLVVRRGRIEAVYPPGPRRQGWITLTVLTKDGKTHAGLGRTHLYDLDFIVGLEPEH